MLTSRYETMKDLLTRRKMSTLVIDKSALWDNKRLKSAIVPSADMLIRNFFGAFSSAR